MNELLEICGLTVELPTAQGWVRPVNDVSLRIDAGECLGLVGESGSGKTMLSPGPHGIAAERCANQRRGMATGRATCFMR